MMINGKKKNKLREESGCRLILVCGWKLLSFEEQRQYWHGREETREENEEGGVEEKCKQGRGWKSSN